MRVLVSHPGVLELTNEFRISDPINAFSEGGRPNIPCAIDDSEARTPFQALACFRTIFLG